MKDNMKETDRQTETRTHKKRKYIKKQARTVSKRQKEKDKKMFVESV